MTPKTLDLDTVTKKMKDGPIPGQNYLSDTGNYPWHQKPEIDDFDKGVEEVIKTLFKPRVANNYLTMMQMGFPVTKITQLFLMLGVSKGKWNIDFALLLAGPTAHIFKIMADASDVTYVMGTEDDDELSDIKDADFYKRISRLSEKPIDTSGVQDLSVEEVKDDLNKPQSKGFV